MTLLKNLLAETNLIQQCQEGNKRHKLLHQGYGMPNGMKNDTDETPTNEMQRALIADGGLLDRL